MFQTKVEEKIKTHILCSVTFFFENRAVYGTVKKIVYCRAGKKATIWRTRFACWIPKATDA